MRKLLLLSFHFWLALNMVYGQLVNIKATGTGQTTGHIANLTVHNEGNTPVKVLPQTAYIPSGGQYQPYVAKIPPTTIPPGATVEIPLSGYCADVHTPPVPNGTSMSPIDTWLPVGSTTDPGSGVPILPQPPLKPFDPIDIPGITGSPGFTPGPIPITPEPIPTWPGTDHPVTGIFDPINHPKPFAPVIVEALNEIANAFDKLREDGKIQTPFSGDPVKEREGVIQQSFWIYMAAVTGEEYGKGDFTGKVHDQYSSTTGRPVTSLTEEHKKEMDVGIDQFWNVFTAVGVEAKVLAKETSQETIAQGDETTDEANGAVSADGMECGSIKGKVSTDPEKFLVNVGVIVVYVTSVCDFCPPIPEYEPVVIKEDENGLHPSFVVIPKDSSITLVNDQEKEIDMVIHIIPSPFDDTRGHYVPGISKGDSAIVTPTITGGYLLQSDINKRADSKFFVAPNRCYSITDKDGNYAIGELPPGNYHLKVYTSQKRTNFPEADVVVEEGKATIRNFVLDRVVKKEAKN